MTVRTAVMKTIGYAESFGSHINTNEIKERLISNKIYSTATVEKEISKLKWTNKENKWVKDKIIKAKKLALRVKNEFGGILFLGITGSVASGHPKKSDDIDILIITKSNTLWKNRLLLRWWMYKNGIPHRKYNKKESKDQFCFNLWLDENYLKIPKNKQDLKNAVDLLMLIPLINKNSVYENFLLTNSWTKKFVATGYEFKIKKYLVSNVKNKQINNNLLKKITNWMYFLPQYFYMKPKIFREKVSLYQAFFHQ